MKTLPAGKQHQKPLAGWPSIEDLHIFVTVARLGSFARAASELGLSPSWISKRIAALEKQLDARLFFRNNRLMKLTPEGEKAQEGATEVVLEMDAFVSEFQRWRGALTGDITVGCSFGFGQQYMADALAEFMLRYPALNLKLMLTDQTVELVASGVDVEIHVGDDFSQNYIARKLAANRRVLCASPAYLAKMGMPSTLDQLVDHHCLIINERNNLSASWTLTDGEQQRLCRLNSHHSSNSGNVVLNWALKGHGIALRSLWDVAQPIQRGELVAVLPQWYQEANIWAVYTRRSSSAKRIETFIQFLISHFAALGEEQRF